MDPADKRALKDRLDEKGVELGKAAEELKVPEQIIALYLTEDSNPIPKRIVDGLNNLIQ
ncbi:MAG: hypothetical protein JSU72_16330 [Deltaproteobacteria bacterium]|nr:MAG: hypothetical protein JSU72_16330 [Deltaproteobacteria bacterium]